jgi:hypothetical protein
MFPFGFNWDVIKAKEGDYRIVTLSPSECSTLVALMLNLKAIADNGGVPQMSEDKDEFDAHCDGLIQKLII